MVFPLLIPLNSLCLLEHVSELIGPERACTA